MKLSPLTPEERSFAEENHSVVSQYLQSRKLKQSEWYDIAVFGYMLSVQKWFRLPGLQKYPFYSIAKQSMRSAIGNEQRKQERRIQTVSLDEVIPGTEDATYGDIITYENLNYKGVYDMKISYNVKIPERKVRGVKSEEVLAVENFLINMPKTKNMCFEYDNPQEAKSKASSMQAWKRKNNFQDVIDVFRVNKCMYIVRKEKK